MHGELLLPLLPDEQATPRRIGGRHPDYVVAQQMNANDVPYDIMPPARGYDHGQILASSDRSGRATV